MINSELQSALDRVSRRIFAQHRQVMVLAFALLVVAWLALLAFAPARGFDWVRLGPYLLGVGLAFLAWNLGAKIWRDRHWALVTQRTAERIEARFPDLDSRLLTAVEEDGKRRPGRVVAFLPSAVIRETLEHQKNHDWSQVIPTWQRRRVNLALVGLIGLAIFFALQSPERPRAESSPPLEVAAEGVVSPLEIQVDPGNTEIERGTPLLVVARFGSNVPANAQLVVESAEPTSPTAMARSLEDPTFAGRVEAVARDLAYRVAFDGGTSPTYQVKVFTFPTVIKVDAHLNYPSYTALESKTLEDVRHVTAVEGTSLGLTFRLNKEVAQARLVDEKGTATPLEAVAGPALTNKAGEPEPVYQASWVLTDSHKYKVELVDRQGRKNKVATDLSVNVTRNRPATVVMSAPGRDVRVSPVEELKLQAKTEDDFGVVRHGINYITPGGEAVDLVIDEASPSAKKRVADHLLAFETLKAQPDQLVSYFFWAEDIGPDSKPRRASGDLYFAEVRHFEEIFRQGEAPPSSSASEGQQQQNGQQAEKLAELQKQIIAATWKLIRRETETKPTAEFAADAATVLESQGSAIEQTGPMGEALRDPTSKANLQAAVKAMKEAQIHLDSASKGPSIAELRPSLAAEQAAYQALLKLRAREFEVSRQRSRQQQGGGRGLSLATTAQRAGVDRRREPLRRAKVRQVAKRGQGGSREARNPASSQPAGRTRPEAS